MKVGGNIGKNLQTSIENAPKDYAIAAIALKDVVDYLVINVSSPNTPGLRDLQSEETLSLIVRNVKSGAPKLPIFIKVAPDNYEKFQDGVISVVRNFNLAGVICGNTLATHNLEKGGLSGGPVFEFNLKLCRSYAQNGLFVIGAGGIDSALKAKSYIESGAKLVQIYSGLVYEGPTLIPNIIKALKPQ